MTNLLTIISGAIGLIAFIGLCFVYLRGSADKGTIESQERLIKARGEEIDDLTRRVAVAESRVAAVEAENKTLRGAVTHVEEIVQMQQTLERLGEAADRNHSEQVAVLGRILVALEAIAA